MAAVFSEWSVKMKLEEIWRLLSSGAGLEQVLVKVEIDHTFTLLHAWQVKVDHLVHTIVDGVVELFGLITCQDEHELVGLFTGSVQEGVQRSSQIFANLVLEQPQSGLVWSLGVQVVKIETAGLTLALLRRKASASSTNNRRPLRLVDDQSNSLWMAETPSRPIGATSPPVMMA